MKTVGIAIDSYKLPVFERHLKEAGYTFGVQELSKEALVILVKTETVAALKPIAEAAAAECGK